MRRLWCRLAVVILLGIQTASAEVRIVQPGPATSKDIWTTNIFSYLPGPSRGPGGGLDNNILIVGGFGDVYYSLIQFDLADTALPRQATTAVIRLYNGDSGVVGTPMLVYRITAPWDWKTQGTGSDLERLWFADLPPSVQLPPTASRPAELPEPPKNQYYEIDITDLYNSWMTNPSQNFGVMLRPRFNDNNFNAFLSGDHLERSKRPSLVITAAPETAVVQSVLLPVSPPPVALPPPPASPSGTNTELTTQCNQSELPPRRPTMPISGAKLELYSCPFNPDLPSVVISHGWNPDNEPLGWMEVMADKINGDAVKRANVFLWNWQERAKSTPIQDITTRNANCLIEPLSRFLLCKVPFSKVGESGRDLALALESLICAQEGSASCSLSQPTYRKPIHFIGHSLGSGVIVFAADRMAGGRYAEQIDQLTLLDSAYMSFPPNGDAIERLHRSGTFIDNYRSGLGLGTQLWAVAPVAVDINVFLPNFIFFSPLNCGVQDDLAWHAHGYAHLWLTSSWENFRCKDILFDADVPNDIRPYGTAWSSARNGAALRAEAAPLYVSLIPISKWRLTEPPLNSVTRALGALTQEIGGVLAQEVRQGGQAGAELVTAAITRVGEVGQAGANQVEIAITKVGQVGQAAAGEVTVAINVVGDLTDQAAAGVSYALTETKRLSTEATTALINETTAAVNHVKIKAVNTFDSATELGSAAVDKAGHATAQFFEDLTGSIDLSLNSDATLHLEQAVPLGTTVMRFGFEFLVADADTSLEVFVNGIPAFEARSGDSFGKGKVLSEWMNIAPFAGQTVNIAFRISNPTEGRQGVIRLDDLFFARLTPTDAPYAVATAPGVVRLGSPIQLDGTRSTDLGGTAATLSYRWAQVDGPVASIQGPGAPSATVTPLARGRYRFSLEVSDGQETTEPAVVSIQVPSLGDVDVDGDVDSNDLNRVLAARNTPAGGPNDLRDVNGDGKIDVLDARKLTTLCTRPRCTAE